MPFAGRRGDQFGQPPRALSMFAPRFLQRIVKLFADSRCSNSRRRYQSAVSAVFLEVGSHWVRSGRSRDAFPPRYAHVVEGHGAGEMVRMHPCLMRFLRLTGNNGRNSGRGACAEAIPIAPGRAMVVAKCLRSSSLLYPRCIILTKSCGLSCYCSLLISLDRTTRQAPPTMHSGCAPPDPTTASNRHRAFGR